MLSEQHLYELLLQGKVDEFNSIRLQTHYPHISFIGRCFKRVTNDTLYLSGVNFKNVDLFNTIFIHCNLEVSDLSEVNFGKSIFREVDLSDSVIVGTKLIESNLTNVTLSGAILTQADLSYCVCENVDLSHANLAGAILRRCYLPGVNFYGANLAGADLRECNLVGADLTLCDLSYSKYKRRILATAKSLQGATFVTKMSRNKYAELCDNILTMNKVRFVAVFDNKREIRYGGHTKDGVSLKISASEKSILLHISWLTWRLLEQIVQYIGKLLYVIENYQELKLIQVPVSRSEIMFISTEIDSDHYAILKYVLDNITNLHDTTIDMLPLPNDQSSSMITHIDGDFPPIVDYNDARSKIYNIDGVIFANIYDFNSSPLTNPFCVTNIRASRQILDPDGMKISIRNACRVWKSRKKFEGKIGKGRYAFAEYRLVKRISVPLPENALLFIIVRKEVDPLKVVHEIKKILET